MFDEFKKLIGVKKIMSFGGWSFSTEADTAPIFRDGVTSAQRLTFANNVVRFAIDNNLDGLDFDWEYPGSEACFCSSGVALKLTMHQAPQMPLLFQEARTMDRTTSNSSSLFAQGYLRGRRLVSRLRRRSGISKVYQS